nr:hypothetical protein [Tanacetum cinerariifolium]
EDKLPYLEQPIPAMLVSPAGQVLHPDVLNTLTALVKALKEIAGLMLMTMDPDIQKNLEQLGAYDMLKELKMLYHGKTVTELHAMLKLHEQTLSPKDAAPALHAIRAGRVQKNQKKKLHKAAIRNQGKDKAKIGNALVPALFFAPKPKNPPTPKKDNLAKDAICHQCGEVGHWRRNCPVYLAELLKKKKLSQGASTLVSRNNLVYFSAIPWDDIYGIDLSSSNTNYSSMYAISNKRAKLNLDSTLLWHCRLRHISKKHIEKLYHDELLNSTDIKSFKKYVSCMSRKMARKPYSHQVERAKDLLGLIHTDVCGPFRPMSRQEASHFVTFTDDFSRYGYVYFLKYKHEVFETFKVFQKEVENQLGKTIKSLRSDRGGEYTSQDSLDHLKKHRIITHRTPPYTPQHNGRSERRNRTLLDMVRSMMSQTTLPKSFWDYACKSAARILNMVPTKKVEKIPYENKVFVARNVEFFENSLITQEASGSLEYPEIIQEEDTHPSIDTSLNHKEDDQEIDEPQSDINPIRKSSRTRRAPNRVCLYVDAKEHELRNLGEPANYKAAFLDPESDKWLNAMNVEMQSMKDNEVWDLVNLPPDGKTIGSKWLFKNKTDMDGPVHTFKARLVAKGFTQTYVIDSEETFSPVAYIRAIRILIAIAAFYDYEIWQMDVKTAFLNVHLFEEVYMVQHGASGSYVTFLIMYVDDILIIENNIPMLQDVKSYLGRCFAIKDLGEAAYILGIKIYRDRSKRLIGLCQSAYIEKILKRYFMKNSQRGTIPMQEKLKLSKSQGSSTAAEKQRMQIVLYASAVGSIMEVIRNESSEFFCYTDAGYLTDADDLKSQSGYVFILNGGAVDWKSTKQSIFVTSSTNAEYIAAFDASKEAVWIWNFIYGIGVVLIIEEHISIYCDNTGAIAIAKDHGITKGARHFHAKVQYL